VARDFPKLENARKVRILGERLEASSLGGAKEILSAEWWWDDQSEKLGCIRKQSPVWLRGGGGGLA